jgi:uncharacterized repeat protein (TIGR03803 family)
MKGGKLYGTTSAGGAHSEGTVFELSPSTEGDNWTELVLYSFGSQSGDGANPYYGNLITDKEGNLYGTTSAGGAHSEGTVFELSPPAIKGGVWTETILYSLGSQSGDGSSPYGGLIMDKEGNLYATTGAGGAHSQGTVFELSPPATKGDPWVESILYNFGGQSDDGNDPLSTLIMDDKGNLYGTTYVGGSYSDGTAFNLSPPATKGGAWIETILHSFGTFAEEDGLNPVGGLVMKAGKLYGTTIFGSGGGGTAFELSPPAKKTDPWTETILSSSLESPYPALIIDTKGNLYGTTLDGGANMLGAAFELSPPATKGGAWTETILYSFGSQTGDASSSYGGLIMDKDGNLYGMTFYGGAHNDGAVFEVTP